MKATELWDRTILNNHENTPITKSIDPGQPARTSQADLSRYFLQIHQSTCPKSKIDYPF